MLGHTREGRLPGTARVIINEVRTLFASGSHLQTGKEMLMVEHSSSPGKLFSSCKPLEQLPLGAEKELSCCPLGLQQVCCRAVKQFTTPESLTASFSCAPSQVPITSKSDSEWFQLITTCYKQIKVLQTEVVPAVPMDKVH